MINLRVVASVVRSVKVSLERVETVGPHALVRLEPARNVAERSRRDPVDPTGAQHPDRDGTGVTQDTQVLGDGRLRQSQGGHQTPDVHTFWGTRAVILDSAEAELIKDAATCRLSQHCESVHSDNVRRKAYALQGIFEADPQRADTSRASRRIRGAGRRTIEATTLFRRRGGRRPASRADPQRADTSRASRRIRGAGRRTIEATTLFRRRGGRRPASRADPQRADTSRASRRIRGAGRRTIEATTLFRRRGGRRPASRADPQRADKRVSIGWSS